MSQSEPPVRSRSLGGIRRFVDFIRPVSNRVQPDENEGTGVDEEVPEVAVTASSSSFSPVLVDMPVEYEFESEQIQDPVRGQPLTANFSAATRVSADIPTVSSGHFQEYLSIPNPVRRESLDAASRTSRLNGRQKIARNLFHVWDNRLSMRLFGSKRKIREEQERQEGYSHWVIHPCSKFR